ncbi:MAG: hypothetical protein JXA22_01130 [Candidatus Thermoplasmatota archaeon]|nr:hypothetical protein [Candidatus Thermoplasmatota archaeon]
MFAEVLNIFFWFAALVLISYLLDMLWAYSLWRWVYIIFAAPGIVVHELSHYLACKITFTEVIRVKLISKSGGSVTHGPPKGGVFGQVLISMAPFIGIPVVLILFAILFDAVSFFNCDLRMTPDLSGNMGQMIIGTLSSAWDLIHINLWDNGSPWFLLYLYLAASLTASLAPSKQDFINAFVGLIVIILILGGWALVLDLVLESWEAPVATFLVDLFSWVVAVGLVMSIFGLLIGLPFLLIKKVYQWQKAYEKQRKKEKKKEKVRRKKQKEDEKKDRDRERRDEKKRANEIEKQRKKIEMSEREMEDDTISTNPEDDI